MIICGLKLTHDSSVAIIEDDVLKFSIELEKRRNNNRFKIINDLSEIEQILESNGYPLSIIDKIIVDGWVGSESSIIKNNNRGKQVTIEAAPYLDQIDTEILHEYNFNNLQIGVETFEYGSYNHVSGHILSAYCTSPFAKRGEDSFVLVWDGGMYPRLYLVKKKGAHIIFEQTLFYFGANCYSIFAQHFGPFKINENVIKDELSIAGKVMAYASYGMLNNEILSDLRISYENTIELAKDFERISIYPYSFTREFIRLSLNKDYQDDDILCTFHYFIEQLLVETLKQATEKNQLKNLCLSGGAALNIKWNSAIRKSNCFKNIWVPPFPNDSGSAIGTALCAWVKLSKSRKLIWNVYSGPSLIKNKLPDGWTEIDCTIENLAQLLYKTNLPIIVLEGFAELGPRALGNRSILASPLSKGMKDRLNFLKIREYYRPISPICIEERASHFFDPGTSDPYMLFDHTIKDEWRGMLAEVRHVDNSARLQTVTVDSNPFLYYLLIEFEKLSGIPILCNTSANYKGSGFFPDVYSAAKWGQVHYIYSNNKLFCQNKELD